MELSELTAYAEEKYHIHEERKWPAFPRFSVLADPESGKWLALLMRQWDFDSGTEIQRCDLKCGQSSLSEAQSPYLTWPYRMKGEKWIGIMFDERTEADVIFRLFDRAVRLNKRQGATIVLETGASAETVICPDPGHSGTAADFTVIFPEIPEKISQMRRLYRFEDHSFQKKCMNFYRQGKFMEDYEDDAPWNGVFRRFFPTYHDLNLPQLRGYFTWRTHVRKGEYLPIAESLAYIYIYELLNGIGTDSPEDALDKMRSFETGFLDSGIGDADMRANLYRWMMEYAIIYDVSPDVVRQYLPDDLLQKDDALSVLQNPKEAEDKEVFEALCAMSGRKLTDSPVLKKDEKRGMHLFAEVWRMASGEILPDGKTVFASCFGKRYRERWHPLANAIYYEEKPHADTDYILNQARIYHCRDGSWQVERYDRMYFHPERLKAFLHETERILRLYLKTGRPLHQKPDEAWASVYAETVVREDQKAMLEAARPKISINLSSLARIRHDADVTRDSLMTEEEMDAAESKETEIMASSPLPAEEKQEGETECRFASLDALHSRILMMLLNGEEISGILREKHLMPSVAADTINAALFDEIGDNVLECDGDTITLVEDYREDIMQCMEVNKHE